MTPRNEGDDEHETQAHEPSFAAQLVTALPENLPAALSSAVARYRVFREALSWQAVVGSTRSTSRSIPVTEPSVPFSVVAENAAGRLSVLRGYPETLLGKKVDLLDKYCLISFLPFS
jgi:hypothetical protein